MGPARHTVRPKPGSNLQKGGLPTRRSLDLEIFAEPQLHLSRHNGHVLVPWPFPPSGSPFEAPEQVEASGSGESENRVDVLCPVFWREVVEDAIVENERAWSADALQIR